MILDVRVKEEDSMRITIHGDDKIKSYCYDNSLKKISDSLEYIEKKRFSIGKFETRPLDLRNYNMRVNLKEGQSSVQKTKMLLLSRRNYHG